MKHTLTIIALALSACTSTQQQQLVLPTASSTIINAYWQCDDAAKVSMLGFGEATQCSVIYEALLKSFPGPDKFQQFLAWWKANKDLPR